MALVGFMMFFSGFLGLVSNRKHTLNMLLSLEFVVLSLAWALVICVSYFEGESYFVLYFLTFAACEGALGLSLIVMLIRSYGSDLILSLNLTQC
uniref:NADH-ubiquinone oxidoreductase chain 4L n=1 Tax=Antrokoreana gracilipes TaxID=364406 RepID=A9X4I9_ANTGC|nr:NADH dehydrogenase subunit 4L [Antrokoreana gracilipes]ABC55889.1 NADH dehydrogenase subunit 4L [Antrokoreana gracilipes]